MMELTKSFQVTSLDETVALGRQLGTLLFPGAIIGLIGPLGAGKTFFTRALAEGIGIPNPDMVTSPTFVLIQEYPSRLPIYHFDTYRLPTVDAFAELGVHEYFASDGVSIIEWADRVLDTLPDERLLVTFTVNGPASRILQFGAVGTKYQSLLESLTG